jgi:urease subunit gamma/beta
VRLTPGERDRLLIFTTAELARRRLARGLRLNVPESTALIADTVCEAARDGRRLHEAISAGRAALGPGDVLPGVPEVMGDVKVEAVFDDGTRLVVVTDPIGAEAADPGTAPGAVLLGPEPPADWPGAVTVFVTNTSTVPISVTSHFHFFESNPRLRFDRAAAYGMRLAIPAGSSIRFGQGERTAADLTPIGGDRVAIGFAGLVDGPLDAPGAKEEALRRAVACGYQHEERGRS